MTIRRSMFTFAMLMAPRAALACPVCFGQSDSPLAKAMNLGILAMLVVVAGILAETRRRQPVPRDVTTPVFDE